MIDEQLRSGLAQLAADVRPGLDPFGRLMARHRRTRRRRFAAAALVAVSAVLVGTVGPLGAGSPVQPPPGTRGWAQRVVDAPPRGGVGMLPGFAEQLAAELIAQNRAEDTDPLLAGFREIPVAQRTVRVLYVDDIGDVRVAAAALLPPADGVHQVLEDTVMAWMVAPRGASAGTLVSAVQRGAKPSDTDFLAHGLEPFTVEEVGLAIGSKPGPMAVVGLAPPGCEVASAALPGATDWRAEPTGDYIVRTPASRRAEWWQVTCDGTVRHQGPAPVIADPNHADNVQVTDADLEAGLAGARASVDPDTYRAAMWSLTVTGGYSLTSRPVAVWGGRVSGVPPSPANAVVVAAPMVDGGWAGMVTMNFDQASTEVSTGAGMFNLTTDPRDPAALLAIRLQQPNPSPATTVLAVAPSGTAAVRAVQNGQQLSQVPVTDGAAVLIAPDRPDVTVEAISATGTVLARAKPVGPGMTVTRNGVGSWDD